MCRPPLPARDDTQLFNDWSRQQAVIPGIFELNDYDYNKPNANLSTHEAYFTPPERSIVYDYPGGYDDKSAWRPPDKSAAGSGTGHSRTAARRADTRRRSRQDMRSSEHRRTAIRRMATISSCAATTGTATSPTHRKVWGRSAADGAYTGSYELSRFRIPYRMPLRTRRPVIIGSQPAKVISKENQEIDVDKYGRVLVEFYWDDTTGSTAPKKTPSRRVRVGQFWAGFTRGALFIPRVGDEVMVEYENGDPDRPIVVGSVYNGTSENPGNLISLDPADEENHQRSARKDIHGWRLDDP